MDTLLTYASRLYAIDYFGIIIVMSLLECVAPRRAPGGTLRLRWFGNISISVLDTLLLRSLFPLVELGWAVSCQARGWGWLNHAALPTWFAFGVTLVVLDAVTYGQHYVLHHVPVLWRIHRTHHSDHECDFTTAARVHPLESIYTTAIIFGTIAVLGAPPIAVLVSQLLSTAVSFIEHANLRLPSWIDRVLRMLVVTPDMHQVHHSDERGKTNSNYGTTFPWWDRLFGTYVDQAAAGRGEIRYGLAEFKDPKHLTLHWMLAQPFLPIAAGEPLLEPPPSARQAARRPC
jgi:sterol desaturase/sphingolipid hydroxylase (fatty acid hydroxylase superfamily)